MDSVLEMSDEEFMKMNSPEDMQETETQQEDTAAAAPVDDEEADTASGSESEQEVEQDTPAQVEEESSPATVAAEPAATTEAPQQQKQAVPEQAAADYEGFYKQVMSPLVANGKTIEIRSPAEAIQLMQMGANYTQKMQKLAPHRKVLMMLENNGLLDESRLSYLIDLDKKNPEAIKKLVKEAGIDPLDIDTSVEPTYQEGNHRVSEQEVAFNTVLEDAKSTPEGMQALTLINSTWDKPSIDALWDSPEIMLAMRDQVQSGVYAVITEEMERMKTFGAIPVGTPFIQAYRMAGDALLAKQGATTAVPQQRAPVATRVVTKPKVTDNSRVAAAAPTRSGGKQSTAPTNFLAMSDEDFLKAGNIHI